jgi:hypothetical protein
MEQTYLAKLLILDPEFLPNDVKRPVAMNLLNLNRSSMSSSSNMNQTTLTFSKPTAVQTSKEIVEKELLIKHDDICLINLVDQDIEELHVGDEEIVAICDSVGAWSSPRKLNGQLIQQTRREPTLHRVLIMHS